MSKQKIIDNLDSDQKFLLKLIIDFFIEFNEEVSSKRIKEFYKLDISTATIRNRMTELEKLNYISKNSKTSGRIPTDLGYHYYVNFLRETNQEEIKDLINHLKEVVDNRSLTIEEVVAKSCKIISDSINITSLCKTGEDTEDEVLNHIDFYILKERQTLSIIVTDTGRIYSKNFSIDKSISLDDLKACISIINQKLKGIKLSEISQYLLSLKPVFLEKIIDFERLFESCLCKIFRLNLFNEHIYGIENLIAPNQFQQIQNLKNLIKVLENHSVWEILKGKLEKSQEQKDEDIKLLIGKEIDKPPFGENLSLISTTYTTNEDNNISPKSGKIMLIAPKSINYSNIFYILKWLKDNLKNRQN